MAIEDRGYGEVVIGLQHTIVTRTQWVPLLPEEEKHNLLLQEQRDGSLPSSRLRLLIIWDLEPLICPPCMSRLE